MCERMNYKIAESKIATNSLFQGNNTWLRSWLLQLLPSWFRICMLTSQLSNGDHNTHWSRPLRGSSKVECTGPRTALQFHLPKRSYHHKLELTMKNKDISRRGKVTRSHRKRESREWKWRTKGGPFSPPTTSPGEVSTYKSHKAFSRLTET